MDYSTFLDEQHKERIKQARIQIDILDQQETDMMSELSHRKAERFAQELHPLECWFCGGKKIDSDCRRNEEENYEQYKKSHSLISRK